MPASRPLRLALAGLALLAVLAAGAWTGFEQLRRAVEASLGRDATIGSLRVGWSGVEALDVRVRASARGWPTEDELHARRVLLRPSLASLWSRGWRLTRVVVEDGYVSTLRTRGGALRLLPSLTESRPGGAEQAAAGAGAPLRIDTVELVGATLDVHDASVRQPPLRVRLHGLDATVGPLVLPALDEAIEVEIDGLIQGATPGAARDGRLRIAGTLTPATRDARLDARFTDVDLVALQPYLLKFAEGGVRRGRLDLSLHARVTKNQLHAPGTLTLRDLELNSSGRLIDTFAGVPRQAVLAAMSRDGRIEVKFTLDGRLDDPAFSLNENLATRLASGLAESLGVSLGGVVEGVGNAIKGLFGK